MVPHETAAVSAQVLCTPYHHAPSHFMQSHKRKVPACLAVTCHLHFWQNDRGLLRTTAVGNTSQRRTCGSLPPGPPRILDAHSSLGLQHLGQSASYVALHLVLPLLVTGSGIPPPIVPPLPVVFPQLGRLGQVAHSFVLGCLHAERSARVNAQTSLTVIAFQAFSGYRIIIVVMVVES